MLDRTSITQKLTKWLPEYIDFLRELLGQGKSPAIAAEDLNSKFGTSYSRNAIIGAAHRKEIAIPLSSLSDTRRVGRRQRNGGRAIKKPKATTMRLRVIVPDIDDMKIPFEQRRTFEAMGMCDCRWPVGDPGTPEFFFCGAPKTQTSAYCPAHFQRSIKRDQ